MAQGTSTAGTGEDYRNAELDVERRVDDLLDRMSLAEKAGRGVAAEHGEANNREENRNSKHNKSVHSGILQ